MFAAGSVAPMRCMQSAQTGQVSAPSDQVDAVGKALAVLVRGAREYPEHRQCFACHHQTLPLLAWHHARGLELPRDEKFEAEITEFVDSSFRSKISELEAGEGIGGKGLTVGYGLWTFRLAGVQPDKLTAAMVTYLLKTQADDGHWGLHSIRPPAEESEALCTILAAAGVAHYATPAQQPDRDRAIEKARAWMASSRAEIHEDRVARAWGWKSLGGTEAQIEAARQALLETQRASGGWSTDPGFECDAYATATALYALLESGLPKDHPAIERGVQFLRESQKSDGSWHVATRATPVQVFFDNGDPHGNDQFISIMATGWSAAVLARVAQ